MKAIKYQVDKTGLILTRCELFGCKVGGWQCVNCSAFIKKDMKSKYVTCNRDLNVASDYKPKKKRTYYERHRDEVLAKKAARLKAKNEQKA